MSNKRSKTAKSPNEASVEMYYRGFADAQNNKPLIRPKRLDLVVAYVNGYNAGKAARKASSKK